MVRARNEREYTRKELIDAYNNIWEFADLINFRGGKGKFGKVHYELASFLTAPQLLESEENRRRLILMPRGHLKSTVSSVLYSLWRIYRNPNIRILVGTNIKRLGRGFIRELRQYFENGDLQQRVWNKRPHVPGNLVPAISASDRRKRNSQRNNDFTGDEDINFADDTKLIWSMEALQVLRTGILKEPTVMIASVGTTVTGDHYDLLILDDIVDFDNSATENKADSILDWTRDLESVLDPRQKVTFELDANTRLVDYVGDEAVILGTRYYEWDYYQYLIDEGTSLGVKVFTRNIYQNGVDNEEGYIWPEKFGEVAIERVRRRINSPQRFASQYLNTIIAPADAIFTVSNIKWVRPSNVHHTPANEWELTRLGEPTRRVKPMLFIDPAATTNSTSDFTVLTVAGYTETKELIILDIVNGRFTPTEVCENLFALCEKWHLNSVTVEMVAGFKLYEHVIREYMKRTGKIIGIRDYKPSAKLHKKARIEAWLQPLFENNLVVAHEFVALNQEFRNELTLFPKGKHDDVLDTLAAIAEICQPTRKRNHLAAVTPRRQVNSKYGGSRA
jgi:predicted phage terminase large subunit-like protein